MGGGIMPGLTRGAFDPVRDIKKKKSLFGAVPYGSSAGLLGGNVAAGTRGDAISAMVPSHVQSVYNRDLEAKDQSIRDLQTAFDESMLAAAGREGDLIAEGNVIRAGAAADEGRRFEEAKGDQDLATNIAYGTTALGGLDMLGVLDPVKDFAGGLVSEHIVDPIKGLFQGAPPVQPDTFTSALPTEGTPTGQGAGIPYGGSHAPIFDAATGLASTLGPSGIDLAASTLPEFVTSMTGLVPDSVAAANIAAEHLASTAPDIASLAADAGTTTAVAGEALTSAATVFGQTIPSYMYGPIIAAYMKLGQVGIEALVGDNTKTGYRGAGQFPVSENQLGTIIQPYQQKYDYLAGMGQDMGDFARPSLADFSQYRTDLTGNEPWLEEAVDRYARDRYTGAEETGPMEFQPGAYYINDPQDPSSFSIGGADYGGQLDALYKSVLAGQRASGTPYGETLTYAADNPWTPRTPLNVGREAFQTGMEADVLGGALPINRPGPSQMTPEMLRGYAGEQIPGYADQGMDHRAQPQFKAQPAYQGLTAGPGAFEPAPPQIETPQNYFAWEAARNAPPPVQEEAQLFDFSLFDNIGV